MRGGGTVSLYARMEELLNENRERGVFRRIVPKKQQGNRIFIDGRELVNLSSNDYLGLGQDVALSSEFLKTISSSPVPMSSSGSPLLTGAHESYAEAQQIMEELFDKKAIFFNSGFSANSGVISALGTPDTLIIADKLAHASMIDGITASKGKFLRYAHNDMEHLRSLVEKNHDKYDSIIIVTEAVFSMDGDLCDLKALTSMKKSFDNVYLYVDEAHSFGLYHENGAGLCAELGLADEIDFILTTFGKGIGSEGACMLCNETAYDYLINTVRPLIFSTALSPLSFAYLGFILKYMQKRQDLRERLQKTGAYIRDTIAKSGFENLSSSQIIPLLTYDNDSAIKASGFFMEKGFYAMPIRHPTVPKGKARLRLSLSASLSDAQVEALAEAIRDFSRIKK